MVAYGSKANPVDLGPFSRIVEVHWNTAKYVAISVQLTRAFHARTEACSGGDPSPVPSRYSAGYITEASFYYANESSQISDAYAITSKGGATALERSAVTVTGLPNWLKTDFEAFSSWAYEADGASLSGDSGTDIGAEFPGCWWQQPVGGDLGVTVPHSALHFLDAHAADFAMRGFAFTTGPSCYLDTLTGLEFMFAQRAGALSDFGAKSFSITDVSIQWKSHTYKAIGLQIAQTEEDQPTDFPDSAVAQHPGLLWILAERQKETTTS